MPLIYAISFHIHAIVFNTCYIKLYLFKSLNTEYVNLEHVLALSPQVFIHSFHLYYKFNYFVDQVVETLVWNSQHFTSYISVLNIPTCAM